MRTMETREAWLLEACEHLRPVLRDAGVECPPPFRSPSVPKGGRGRGRSNRPVLARAGCGRRAPRYLRSPVLVNAERILDVLLHELVHAGARHQLWAPRQVRRGARVRTGRTANRDLCGPELSRRLNAITQTLGPLPHAALSVVEEPKQTTPSLRLWQCDCEVKVRVASDQFDATCNRCGSRFTRSA